MGHPPITLDPLILLLIGYRWLSLFPALWFFQTTPSPDFAIDTGIILGVVVTYSGVLSIFHQPLLAQLRRYPILLGGDILLMAFLLSLTGLTHSPYFLHALTPLFVAAICFQIPGAAIGLTVFVSLYLWLLNYVYRGYAADISAELVLTQLFSAGMALLVTAGISATLHHLRREHRALQETHSSLVRAHHRMVDKHVQLELMHELSLMLHASDSQTVRQRLLQAVTTNLGFSAAIIASIDSSRQQIDHWQNHQQQSPLTVGLPLQPICGPICEAILHKQIRWCLPHHTPTNDKALNEWIGIGHWLILPLIWQGQVVAVLLVNAEMVGAVDPTDGRWAILTSLVSQAAVALGGIERTRRLAIQQEQNRIACDIHDTVAQSLFGVVFTLDACIKMLPHQVDVVQQELGELRDMAHRVRQQVRQSIHDIWPTELTREIFEADLRKHISHSSPDHVFDVEFAVQGEFDRLPTSIRRTLYRVCQEALVNAARHSGVDTARVYLYIEQDEVKLSVRDKGTGFDPKRKASHEGQRERFGLRGMRERIETLGGRCDILSQLGQGTQILVHIPLWKERVS